MINLETSSSHNDTYLYQSEIVPCNGILYTILFASRTTNNFKEANSYVLSVENFYIIYLNFTPPVIRNINFERLQILKDYSNNIANNCSDNCP